MIWKLLCNVKCCVWSILKHSYQKHVTCSTEQEYNDFILSRDCAFFLTFYFFKSNLGIGAKSVDG